MRRAMLVSSVLALLWTSHEAMAAMDEGDGGGAMLDATTRWDAATAEDSTFGAGVELTGTEMTLYARVRLDDQTAGSILLKGDAADPSAVLLEARDGALVYTWRTSPLADRVLPGWLEAIGFDPGGRDFSKLEIGAPLGMVAAVEPVDVVVRFRGPNLELFVDGVLVDEEWPHGALHQFRGPFTVAEALLERTETVALWNRALSDQEIEDISGEAERVTRRDAEILGPAQASMQYWKPRGHNAFAGDCIPFYHDGVFHLFYLFDRRHHGSKWGQGAHQYAHAATRDLIHWEHHPLAVPIIRQWECSMGTGDVIEHDGLIQVFYTDCGGRMEYADKPQRGHRIFRAVSEDGVHFTKDLAPLVEGHDCEVLRDPATGLFHLVRGDRTHFTSGDLRSWTPAEGEFAPHREGTSDECPNHFEWNGWFYFILGRNALWRSRSAIGPWEEIPATVYEGLMVPKVAEFAANRRLMAGFLEYPGWGGHIVFRELVQTEDGRLGTTWAPEMIPASLAPVAVRFDPVQGNVTADDGWVTLDGSDGLAICALDGVPSDAHLSLRIEPGPGVTAYGVTVRGGSEGYSGCELKLEPGRERAQWGAPRDGGLAPDSTGAAWQGGEFAIADVEALDQPLRLDLLTRESILDACIDGRRTMVTRRRNPSDGERVFLFAEGGAVTFRNIEVRPLA